MAKKASATKTKAFAGLAADARPEASRVFARNIDWNLFKIFCQIARSGSIGAAARALNRQQPSISVALQRLEAHLVMPLCVRTQRGITLTEFGAEVLNLSQEMNIGIERLPRAAAVARHEMQPPVTLAVISNLHVVPKLNAILTEFREKMPSVEMKLNVTSWFAVIESVLSGEVDIGFGFLNNEASGSLIKLPIINQIQQLYCGPTHPLFGKTCLDLKLLYDEPFVVPPRELPFDEQFRERYKLGQTIRGVSDNLQERMWLIRLGVGIGLLPKPIVEASDFANELWPLLEEEKAPIGTIFLMARTERLDNRRAQVLWDVARVHLQVHQSETY
jgi:DNA-binding transcriptional LysR family regulator